MPRILYNLPIFSIKYKSLLNISSGVGEFLQNMYVWLWAALAILMIIVGIKYRHEHQGLLAVLMAVFFIFMTVWYGLRTFAGYPMFEGTLNIIFRCILGGFLVALGLIYWFIRKRK